MLSPIAPPFSLGQAAALRLAQKTVDQRAPDNNDDVNAGYLVNDYWQFGGNVWKCVRNTAGAAAWQTLYNNSAPVVDAVGVAVLCAYGIKKLVNSYSGPCVNIVRASDGANLDVGFLSSGWIDWDSASAFMANTSLVSATWYDHYSTANHATQPTAANRPTIGKHFLDGRPAISMDQTSGTVQYFVLPSGVAVTRENFSVACIGMPGGDGQLEWDLSSNGTLTSIRFVGVPTIPSYTFVKSDGTVYNAQAQYSGRTCLAGLISGASGYTSFTNTDQVTGAAFSTTAVSAGGLIGESNLGGIGVFQAAALWQGFIVWNSALTTAQLTTLQLATFCAFDIKPQIRENLVLVGDSILYGQKAQIDNLPQKLAPLLARPMRIINQGVPGATCVSAQAYTAAWLAQSYRAGATNIAVVWLGTNSLAATPTQEAQVWADLQTLCGIVRAAGYKIVLVTMLPRDIGGGDTYRQVFNPLVTAGWASVADALADVGSDPTMGPYAAIGNSALYPDGLHSSGLGYDYLAPTIAVPVNKLLLQNVA
jgi:lysophospholipase L1-like esterase